VWDITEDNAGDIWVATGGGGVNRFNPARRAFTRYLPIPGDSTSLPDALTYSVFEDSRQRLWIGTVTRSLARYDRATDSFVWYPPGAGPSHYSVWPILEDRRGTLWLGTVGSGVNRLDAESGRFERFPNVPDLLVQASRLKVVSMTEAGDGAIWAATMGNGVVRLDPEANTLRAYVTADSLAHTSVACVLPGDGNDLWVATAAGLSYFDGERQAFTKTYTPSDGLPDAAFLDGACHRSRRGELFFGTNDGLVAFFPRDIRDNETPPLAAITGFDLFGKPYVSGLPGDPVSGARLKHNENEVTLHFAALEFTSPAENRFAYRLDDVDAGWVFTSDPFARYPNLAPGDYTFRVKAANSDGAWSAEHATLAWTIRPYFFWQWWVQAIFWSVLLFGAWKGVRYRLKSELKTSQLEVRTVQLERQVEGEREKSRQDMVRKLHDDIGSELSAIVLRVDFLASRDRIPGEDRRELRAIWESSRRVGEFFRDATWGIESGHDRLTDLIDRLEEYAYHLFRDGRSIFNRPDILPDVMLDSRIRQELYQIGKEAILNARRHAGAEHVAIEVTCSADFLMLTVADDGVGFDAAAEPAGHGLRHMRERAEAIGADLTIESAPEQGCRVTLRARIA